MIPNDFPRDWYWLAEDGRLYSSARQMVVADDDDDYRAWREAGRIATRWPQDDAGEQTTASLQEVLTPHGLWIDLIAYAAEARWHAEQRGTLWAGLPIHTDDRSQAKYLSELQAIALGMRIDGDPWKFADGVFRPVANADFPALAIAARAHVREVFAIEGAALAAIDIGEITTLAEIDLAFSG